MERVGVYPGTFDPVTKGHMDIIVRGAGLVDRMIVGVATNPGKGPLFGVDERVDMVRQEVADVGLASKVDVVQFGNLLMHFVEEQGGHLIIRGLRAVSDFEYEFQMAGMNSKLNSDIETVFLTASDTHQLIASRLVKEIGFLGGDVSQFVSARTEAQMRARFDEMRREKGQD